MDNGRERSRARGRAVWSAAVALPVGMLLAHLAFSGSMVAYLQQSFMIPLAITAVVILAVAVWTLMAEADNDQRDHTPADEADVVTDAETGAEPDNGANASASPACAPGGAHVHADDGHHRFPRVAFLLLVPVLLYLVCQPRPLGAFTSDTAVNRSQTDVAGAPRGTVAEPELSRDTPTPMTLNTYVERHRLGDPTKLEGRPVRMIGFLSRHPDKPDAVTLSRLMLFCCAADALPFTVVLTDAPQLADLPVETWVEVVGMLDPSASEKNLPALKVSSHQEIPMPEDPYL